MDNQDRPLLIDFFCGAGGCSVGYSRAGFDVIGCDIEPQKRYPFDFLQMDALEALQRLLVGESLLFGDRGISLADVAAFHASPPCQAYSKSSPLANDSKKVDMIADVRFLLRSAGKPYIIENVEGSPLLGSPLLLCGTMFDLRVIRHRYFENNICLWVPPSPCNHWSKINENGFCTMFGRGASKEKGGNKADWQRASGIDWMTVSEMSQAIPPAYTEFIGKVLLTASVELHTQPTKTAAKF